MRNLICLFFIALMSCSNLKFSNPPSSAVVSFQQKYPEVEADWGQDSDGKYEARFEIGGEAYRADFGLDGDWIETENFLKYKQLPELSKQTVESKYNKDLISEIKRVDHHKKGLFYKIEFENQKNTAIEINAQGEIL